MTSEILFDNFIVTNDKYVADKFAADRLVYTVCVLSIAL